MIFFFSWQLNHFNLHGMHSFTMMLAMLKWNSWISLFLEWFFLMPLLVMSVFSTDCRFLFKQRTIKEVSVIHALVFLVYGYDYYFTILLCFMLFILCHLLGNNYAFSLKLCKFVKSLPLPHHLFLYPFVKTQQAQASRLARNPQKTITA